MIISALAPMMATQMETPTEVVDDSNPNTLKEADRQMNTGGRAPCPAVQSDGGTAGDAGNTSATAKSLGNDPSTSISGCIDSTDTDDWYGIQLTANKDIVVVLGNFGDGTNVDFDLGLSDSTGTSYVDVSASYAAEERVTFTTNSSTAGTYYIQVVHWAGDGSYDLDVWTNNSVPKPDLSVNSISGPVNATAGDTVDVTYTVENFGPGDTNSTNPYDVVFILSTDDTYDWSDVIVESQIAGPYLTAGSSSVETSQLTIPSDIDSDDYHWIVWPDGWGKLVLKRKGLRKHESYLNKLCLVSKILLPVHEYWFSPRNWQGVVTSLIRREKISNQHSRSWGQVFQRPRRFVFWGLLYIGHRFLCLRSWAGFVPPQASAKKVACVCWQTS